jgi:hypothetical protein
MGNEGEISYLTCSQGIGNLVEDRKVNKNLACVA